MSHVVATIYCNVYRMEFSVKKKNNNNNNNEGSKSRGEIYTKHNSHSTPAGAESDLNATANGA